MMNVMENDEKGAWIMDSGCSFHMCPNRNWFQDLDETDGTVSLGNNQTCRIKGVGSIFLRVHDGTVKMLLDVRFIPEVKRNLISLGTLEKKGLSFTSENGEMRISKNSKTKMIAQRMGSLYYLEATVVNGEANSIFRKDLRSWHLRLGHPAEGIDSERADRRKWIRKA